MQNTQEHLRSWVSLCPIIYFFLISGITSHLLDLEATQSS